MARSTKEKTYEQAAATQEKAVRFLRGVVGDQEKADEIESLSVSEYASRKGLVLVNPSPRTSTRRRENNMETEEVDLAKLPKAELVDYGEDWGEVGDNIWNEAVIPHDDGEITAEDAISLVAEILNEFDPERYPVDEDDAAEGDQEDAA